MATSEQTSRAISTENVDVTGNKRPPQCHLPQIDPSCPIVADIPSERPLERVTSHDDLYEDNEDTVTPPAYTQMSADGEFSIDAEAALVEKPTDPSLGRSVSGPAIPQPTTNPIHLGGPDATGISPTSPTIQQSTATTGQEPRRSIPIHACAARSDTPFLYHYLTEPVARADLIGARACSILQDRAATWLLMRSNIALSPLAAAILLKEGLIREKDLSL